MTAATVEPKLPDHMGVWSDGGEIVWLPRALYANRHAARKFAMDEWGCGFLGVYITTTWMRYEEFVARHGDGSVAWQEDRWFECDGHDPGAFKVWRLEAA